MAALSSVHSRLRSDGRKPGEQADITNVLQDDDKRMLECMLNNGLVSTSKLDECQQSILHKACAYHCPQCILLLLRNGAHNTIKLYDVAGYAPVHIAASTNAVVNLKALLRDRRLCDHPTALNETPIMIGCLHGHLDVVEYLHSHAGANLHHRAADNSTVLHYAASSGCGSTLEYLLNQRGVREYVNAPNKIGDTPAHNAMKSGCAECVRVLCEYGADFTLQNRNSQSPTGIAKSLGNRRCLAAAHSTALCVAAATVDGLLSEPKHDPSSAPPESLKNDKKAEFHIANPRIETASLEHGGNMSALRPSSSKQSSDDRVTDALMTNIPIRNGHIAREQRSETVALAPLQPMKQKTTRPKGSLDKDDLGRQTRQSSRTPQHPQTDPVRKKMSTVATERAVQRDAATTERDAPLRHIANHHIETASLEQGGEMSALRLSSSKQSSDDHGTDVLVTNVPIRNGHIAQQNGEESLQRSESQLSRTVALAPLQPMKQKTTRPKDSFHKEDLGRQTRKSSRTPQHPQTDPVRKKPPTVATDREVQQDAATTEHDAPLKSSKSVTDVAPSTNSITHLDRPKCGTCGAEKRERNIVIEGAKWVDTGYTIVNCADRVTVPDWICDHCKPTPVASLHNMSLVDSRHEERNQSPTAPRHEERNQSPTAPRHEERNQSPTAPRHEERNQSPTVPRDEKRNQSPTAPRHEERNQSLTAPRHEERSLQSPEDEIPDLSDGSGSHSPDEDEVKTSESGYGTIPAQINEPFISIETDLPIRVKGKYGEEVTVKFQASTDSNYQLEYCWYKVEGGKSTEIWRAAELKWMVKERSRVKVVCRAYLKNREDVFVESKTNLIPLLVWFTEQLRLVGRYKGKRAVLKCQAEKAPFVKGKISYRWMKHLKDQKPLPYGEETERGDLIFDPFTAEHNGYYTCQAEVKSVHFEETNEVLVQGSIEPVTGILITMQPRSRVVVEGGSFKLQCRAEFKPGVTGSWHYQWFHNNTAIPEATSSTYERCTTVAADTGDYYCRVTRQGEESVNTEESVDTEQATVELRFQEDEETDGDSGNRSIQQCNQVEAERVLRTSTGRRYACDKVGLLIGNDTYTHLHQLSCSAADVRILRKALTEAGFKVFSLVNLKCDEIMEALEFIRNLLVAGVYVVFAYIGHGWRVHNDDYIIPIDANCPLQISECIASATVSEYLQSKLCRVFLIMNCCRVQPQGSYQFCENKRNSNYANIVVLTATGEDQQAFEVNGQSVSSFMSSVESSLEKGGGYMDVFERVQEKKTEPVKGVARATPRIHSTSMDRMITFQDDIMLDDEQHEEKLDELQKTWRAVNTPPDPVNLPDVSLGPDTLLQDVKLIFNCDFSNVLVVMVKWRANSSTCTSFSIDMAAEGQGVGIKRSSVQDSGACFRVTSLQRLSGDLRLQLIFLVSDGTCTVTCTHNLHPRPLYAQFL